MEKAYAKLHGNYQSSASVSTLDVLVDLTGGLAEQVELHKEDKKDTAAIWNTLYAFMQQKFLLIFPPPGVSFLMFFATMACSVSKPQVNVGNDRRKMSM